MQVKTIRAIARAYNAGLNDRTVNLFKQFKKLKAQRDAAQKALAEEQAKSKSLYENQQDIADTNKRVCERLLAVKAERDAAVARIATLEQQLTDAASRINELEASSVAPAVAPARKKYEAPKYSPLPEGCEIGEEYYQLAVGEVLQEGDEWCLEPNQWRATLCYGGAVPEGYIYRRKQ